jgi:hypothetical protein
MVGWRFDSAFLYDGVIPLNSWGCQLYINLNLLLFAMLVMDWKNIIKKDAYNRRRPFTHNMDMSLYAMFPFFSFATNCKDI